MRKMARPDSASPRSRASNHLGWGRVFSPSGEPIDVAPEAFAGFRRREPIYRAADVIYVYHVAPTPESMSARGVVLR